VFVARGEADVDGAGALTAGDAVRFTDAGPRTLTPRTPDGVEVTVWETHADLG
jgi:quercetin 2,3-dioxygenase